MICMGAVVGYSVCSVTRVDITIDIAIFVKIFGKSLLIVSVSLIFLSKLIIIVDEEVRECVLLSLDEKFDTHLAQAENLTSLFIAIYDGVSQIISFVCLLCVHVC